MQPKPPRRTRERILETALAMFNQLGEPTVATDGERNREILLGSAERAEALTRPISRGAEDGRWPTDHGFDVRTYDECMWPKDPHYVPERDGLSYMHEGREGEGVRPILSQQLTLEMKTCDLEYQARPR